MGGDEKIELNSDREVLGKRIAQLREERGWRQVDLAHRAGLSHRTITLYERQGPPVTRLGLLDAVFGGELLRDTVLETLPLDGMPSREPANGNGTSDPAPGLTSLPTRDFVVPEDPGISPEHAADQDCVTSVVEPLGLLLDEVFGRLRALERAVADLVSQLAEVASRRRELERSVTELTKAQANR